MLAAMDLFLWTTFASLMLVCAGASRYDQGPQRFYDVSNVDTADQNNREVIVYLTPDQVKNLEVSGAVVSPIDSSESEVENESGPTVLSNESEEQEDEEYQHAEKDQKDESVELENLDIDFDEILKILNEQQVQEEAAEEPARNEPQNEDDNIERPRKFSPKFNLRHQQQEQEEKYVAPVVANKEQRLKSFSSLQYQSNEQPQKEAVLFFQQHPAPVTENEKDAKYSQNRTPENLLKQKFKLVPIGYEVEETPDENTQEANSQEPKNSEAEDDVENQRVASLLNAETFAAAIGQRKNSLLQSELELQTILRELKISPKFNDQKYAIEIEKLRTNLEKQNALSKAEAIAKATPALIKQQIEKKRLFNKSSKLGKGPETQVKSKQNPSSSDKPRLIPVPVIKADKVEVVRPIPVPVQISKRPIPVPVETQKRINVKNIYVKTDKLYTVQLKAPENKKQGQTEKEIVKSGGSAFSFLKRMF